MTTPRSMILLTLFVGSFWVQNVEPHGRLIEPPSRSTMWRYGFNTPPNYNDHELYCGGYSRQWRTNGGKCGICGDPWDTKQPRANEAGGMFGKGVIVRKYEMNQVIKIRIELTANHMGFFEFRLCPNNAPHKTASQLCLDLNLLKQTNENGPRYYPGPGSKVFEMHYQLPQDLTCKQCVFQWRYVAGNNWGRCSNGTESVGCGPQEEFRACSDVSITTADGYADATINELVDPEIYVPRNDEERYNEVDFDAINNEDQKLKTEVAVESVVIIVLASILVTVLFFGGLFLYYTRGKTYIDKYVKDKDWPELPQMPKIMPKKLTSALHWPLSNVQIKNLPIFLTKKDAKNSNGSATTAEATSKTRLNIDLAKRPLPARPPQPPPRVRKQDTNRVGPKSNNSTKTGGPQRPNVPPPAAPTSTSGHNPSGSGAATIEIGEPTSVTINGVKVVESEGSGGPEANVTASSGPSSMTPSVTAGSFIVPATPAMANEDIPDSMQSVSLQLVPPPVPTCPPPEFDDDEEQFKNESNI